MKRFLLLALTAGLISHIPAEAFFGEKDGTKVWSSHKIINDRRTNIYRTYDSFTDKAKCHSDELDTKLFRLFWELSTESIKFRRNNTWVDIKFGNQKPIRIWSEIKEGYDARTQITKDYMYEYHVIPYSQYSKYRKIRFRTNKKSYEYRDISLDTSELKKYFKSYEACDRSTSK